MTSARRRHLPRRDGAVDGALGQSAGIHAQRELRVLVAPAPSGIMAAHDAAAAPIGTRDTRRVQDIPPADRRTQAAVRTVQGGYREPTKTIQNEGL